MTRPDKPHSTLRTAAKKRPTIGVLTTRIGRVWGNEFMLGVVDTAQALDVNLLCFVGGRLIEDNRAEFSLYDLADPEKLDGVILAADLGHGVSRQVVQRFIQRFTNLPMVALSMELEGVPAILSDRTNGMRLAVAHLINAHQRTRLAFIQGPVGQMEAEQRYQAYLEAIKEHHIPYDPSLVVGGDFTLESGRNAVSTLLDERHMAFDALVAANDRMAFGALEVLQERGLQVPSDVALIGFDDIQEAKMLSVPLTTVRQPFYATGQQAVSTLVSLIKGEPVPKQVVLPTELVLRWSCGCLPPAIRQVSQVEQVPAVSHPIDATPADNLKALRSQRPAALRALLEQFSTQAMSSAARQQLSSIFSELMKQFISDLSGKSQDNFLKAFAQALTSTPLLSPSSQDTSLWQGVLSEFRHQVLPCLSARRMLLRAEDLLEQARILAGESFHRSQAYQRLSTEQQEEHLQSLGHSLATLVSLKEVSAAAIRHFPELGIEHCHVALYDKPDMTSRLPPASQLKAKLLLIYNRGIVDGSPGEPTFLARKLIPSRLLPRRRYSAILFPMSFSQSQLGYVWSEVGPRQWEVHTRLGNLLSSAIFRGLLIKEREDAVQEIAHLLARAEQHSVELDIARGAAEKAAHQLQAALRETEGLFDAALSILGANNLADICLELTEQFSSLVQADRLVIYLMDHDQRRITLCMSNGQILPEPDATYNELNEGLSGIVFKTREALISLSPDDGVEPPVAAGRRRLSGIGAIMVAPLKTKDQVIGTVTALNRLDQRLFTHHDLDLLMSLATQATAAIESTRMYQAEQARRQMAESLVQAGRKLSSSIKLREVPEHILEQLALVVPYERASLILQEGGSLSIVAHKGFPKDKRLKHLQISIREGDVYQQVATAGRPVIVDNVSLSTGWQQVDWLPLNLSWMGVPLFSKDQVIGMLSITRPEVSAFTQDDAIMASTFALQAAIALENAGLYDEITRFNEQLEEMVRQRTEELKQAYQTLEKLDQNKTVFINVAAHELRTPLTVIKGYMGMLDADGAIRSNPYLTEVVKGVVKGTDRLQMIINSMLDVARIDSQVLDMHRELTSLAVIMKRVKADLAKALTERQQTLTLENIDNLPLINADPTLLLKIFQNLVGNAIKYTPDGGHVTVWGQKIQDEQHGEHVEMQVQDTGIGIDPAQLDLIFEKFYQTGTVALHSSGETKFKGGGPGLGLAIVRGIIEAHGGRIWAESEGYDEERCPGSIFHVLLPVS